MSGDNDQNRPKQKTSDPKLGSFCDQATQEILDHLAEELAREYVRLMKKAAHQEDRKSHDREREDRS